MPSRHAFTLIELLVVIAIIAVLAVVVILALNPAELLKQARDSNRISDMSTLNSATVLYNEDANLASLGSVSTLYPSVSDTAATSTAGDQCQGLGALALPAIWSSQCAATSTLKAIDGTGWVPTNFKLITSGSPLGSLPTDPTNTTSSRLYYSYATDGTRFEFTSAMESAKYKLAGSNDTVSVDGGIAPDLFEKGTSLKLMPFDYGDPTLVGYWGFEEGTGAVTYDYSGNNSTGTWFGTPGYTTGKVGTWAGSFDGSTQRISIANFETPFMANQSALTISGWLNLTNNQTKTCFGERTANGGNSTGEMYVATFASGTLNMVFRNSSKTAFSIFPSYVTSTWMLATLVYNGSSLQGYINGSLAASIAASGIMAATSSPFFIGADGFGNTDDCQGSIDDVRVYQRALSAAEILSLYNGGK